LPPRSRPRAERLGCQLLKQSLCLLQVRRVEALGEPVVDRGEEFVRLLRLATLDWPAPTGWSGVNVSA
jgi:hypothetical protein